MTGSSTPRERLREGSFCSRSSPYQVQSLSGADWERSRGYEPGITGTPRERAGVRFLDGFSPRRRQPTADEGLTPFPPPTLSIHHKSAMSTNDIDPTALTDWSRPLDRARAELYCLGRTLMPDDATAARTTATLLFIVVWAAMVLGPLFGVATRPRLELMIAVTAIVFTILGRMWDFEVKRVVNLPLPDGGRQEDDER